MHAIIAYLNLASVRIEQRSLTVTQLRDILLDPVTAFERVGTEREREREREREEFYKIW